MSMEGHGHVSIPTKPVTMDKRKEGLCGLMGRSEWLVKAGQGMCFTQMS